MRYSTVCAIKGVIKLGVLSAVTALILIVSFGNNQASNDQNVTIAPTTPSPEQELHTYITELGSWQAGNRSIVNPHPHSYLNVPSATCKLNNGKEDPFLLIIVKSYVSNLGHREAIRATWGKILPPSVKLVFILGHIDFMKLYVDIESKQYKDIVQEDFLDVYHNNTVKTIMGFNWAVTNCADSAFIYFVDDDYLVNVPKILKYLRSYMKARKGKDLYAGYRWEKAYPKRSNVSKWYVSVDDYPCRIWPPYVGGGSILMSMDVASKMKDAFQYIKPIFIDDVYLGIVAAALGIQAKMLGRFSPDYHPNMIDKLFSTHGVGSSSTMLHDWEKIKNKVIF